MKCPHPRAIYIDPITNHKLKAPCATCQSNWHKTHREQINKQVRYRYKNDKNFRESNINAAKAYYRQNCELIKEKKRVKYHSEKDKI